METRDILRRVRRIEIRTRRLVEEVFAGQSESVFKGRGMEFAEVRPYLAGDEVRDIDWNVTARMGAPFVKRFTEERELTVMLAVDVSGSLEFGSAGVSKRELAAEMAALLDGRAYVTPDDVKAIALDVLRHRIHVTYEAEAEETPGEEIARRVLEKVRVP